jgi:hypothetical protein
MSRRSLHLVLREAARAERAAAKRQAKAARREAKRQEKVATSGEFTAGQRAMAVALAYPEPAKLKRSGSSKVEQQHVSKTRLSEARAVLAYSRELDQ